MLISAKTLQAFRLNSRDGALGSVKEFYFDDRYWTVRYLVADTGGWLASRKVLISPYALRHVSRDAREIDVALTAAQIESSPSLDADEPVSRQFEESHNEFFGWPAYWGGPNMWGSHPYITVDPDEWRAAALEHSSWDAHLRSTSAVAGYRLEATDGEIGHIDDFMIDDETWTIRYLVVDTLDWWPGKLVLIAPQWLEHDSWTETHVDIAMTRESIQQAPEYIGGTPLARDYETILYKHYNRQGYWEQEPVAVRPHG